MASLGARSRFEAEAIAVIRAAALSSWTKSESVRATGFGDETGRLAELGEMTGEELAALQEDANVARLRLGTPAERISGGGRNAPGAVTMDQQDVQLSERVQAARRSSARAGVRSDSRGLA